MTDPRYRIREYTARSARPASTPSLISRLEGSSLGPPGHLLLSDSSVAQFLSAMGIIPMPTSSNCHGMAVSAAGGVVRLPASAARCLIQIRHGGFGLLALAQDTSGTARVQFPDSTGFGVWGSVRF